MLVAPSLTEIPIPGLENFQIGDFFVTDSGIKLTILGYTEAATRGFETIEIEIETVNPDYTESAVESADAVNEVARVARSEIAGVTGIAMGLGEVRIVEPPKETLQKTLHKSPIQFLKMMEAFEANGEFPLDAEF